MSRLRIPVALLATLVAVVAAALPSTAAAREPALTVGRRALARALHCTAGIDHARRTPIMLVTGTDVTGDEAYAIGKPALDAYGAPVCYVDFPDNTTADVQVSVQYLVYGLKVMARRADRPVAVYGTSQGGLLPRVALTYWPSLRSRVSDVVAAAGTMHGTDEPRFTRCARIAGGCPPAVWQQARGSRFLRALNAEPVEAPGPTSWTNVYSATDEVVQPQTGAHPTSALRGATNVLLQSVCPGRAVTHLGTVLDAVSVALLRDAIAHPGPARVSRLPKDVCAQPWAPGLDPAAIDALLANSEAVTVGQEAHVPHVDREPAVRAWVKARVR